MAVQRWTDSMLDELASSVGEMRESITEMREGMTEMRESITEMRESVDGLKITTQALLQVAAQHQQRMDKSDEEIAIMKQSLEAMKQQHAESDERFNVLLAEVRYLIRGKQGE